MGILRHRLQGEAGKLAGCGGRGKSPGQGRGRGQGRGKSRGACRTDGGQSTILGVLEALKQRLTGWRPGQTAIAAPPARPAEALTARARAVQMLACPQCGRRIAIEADRPLADPHCPECGAAMLQAPPEPLPLS